MTTKTYQIKGGRSLSGEVFVSGAKNAATKQLLAALLTDEKVILHNVPNISDVDAILEMLDGIGVQIKKDQHTIELMSKNIKSGEVPAVFSRKNRIPILMIGPLLHRFGYAKIPLLGGCKIGARSVDMHLDGFKKMGATIEMKEGYYIVRATKLKGAMIHLDFPSVGATENLMLAAVKARGTTTITNAAIEPEVMDTAKLLQSMGAIIHLDVNRTWIIEGVPELQGAEYEVIPDRMEAASFAMVAALTKGDVFVRNARQHDMISFLNALRKVGVPFKVEKDGIRFQYSDNYQPIVIETDTHPGFMTDWQQPFAMLLTQAKGVSIIHETIFEDRFGYTNALVNMGANIQLHSDCLGSKTCRYKHQNFLHSCIISGPTKLQPADIVIPDLRAGFSYLLAGLMAEGTSNITGVEHIERGYEDIIGKLQGLGADISVINQ